MALLLDVTDERAVARGVAAIVARLGRVDVLVNNAGIAESAPFAKTDTALWERHLHVNATGPYLLARAVLPAMLERRWARGSTMAPLPGPSAAPKSTPNTPPKTPPAGSTRPSAP